MNKNGKVTIEDAKRILTKETKQHIEQCQKDLYNLLEKYNCVLDVSITLTSKSIIPHITILAK